MSEIRYWSPVEKAWDKMVDVLFRPFDFGKWMVIGFTAFLAQCGREAGSGGSFGNRGGSRHSSGEEFSNGLITFRDTVVDAWYAYSGLIIFGICSVIVLLLLISVLVNWLNSRGQFMFLDNVLKNRGAVQEPWSEYSREANSLLIFQLVFNWIAGPLSLLLVGGMIVPIFIMIAIEQFVAPYLGVAIGSLLLLMVFSIACGFTKIVLSHFVVPLMYQRRLKVLDGFRAFGPVFKTHFWRLVLFGLVMILINTVIGVALMIAILLTCCTAFLVLIIPYISTVAMLPVYVFYRFIGLEFLRQFGDEYDLLTEVDAASPEPALLAEDVDPESGDEPC